MKFAQLNHEFVVNLADHLEPGVLYISIRYATVAHLCGCGVEVVTPLTPTDWKMMFDGETISLWPSVGNWNEACRSHYIIERNQVITSSPWPDRRIEAERRRNQTAKEKHYKKAAQETPAFNEEATGALPPSITAKPTWWAQIKNWLRGR